MAYGGGIAGWSDHVDNSYNRGAISVTATGDSLLKVLAGGIAGWTQGMIEQCYHVGEIELSAPAYLDGTEETKRARKGGLAGAWVGASVSPPAYVQSNSFAPNLYIDPGWSTLFCGTQKSEAALKQKATYLNLGSDELYGPLSWNFDSIWTISPGRNDGFPYHRYETLGPVEVLDYDNTSVRVYSTRALSNVTAWAVAYDSNGCVTSAAKGEAVNLAANAEGVIPLSFDSTADLTIFIWTENMEPLCEPWVR